MRFILLLLSCIGLLTSTESMATRTKFAMTALTDTAWVLPANFQEVAQYRVTNQTAVTRTLTIKPLTGVTQITTDSSMCSSPFTLAPQESCLLTLQINGSQIPSSGITGGPEVCKTQGASNQPDPFLCSQPDAGSKLAVSTNGKMGSYIYVSDFLAGNVISCQINPVTGKASQCKSITSGYQNPEAITINPEGSFLYITDTGNKAVSVCNLNTLNGTASSCVNAQATGLDLPNGLSVSPSGDILYISNGGPGDGNVSACDINTATGILSNCVNNPDATFSKPFDITLNSSGTFAYIANYTNSTVSTCPVNGKTVGPCVAQASSVFDGPEGITLNPTNTYIYITNNGSNTVAMCDIDSASNLLQNCALTNGRFDGTGNPSINSNGTQAYIPNAALSKIFSCNVIYRTGELDNCLDAGVTEIQQPSGTILR